MNTRGFVLALGMALFCQMAFTAPSAHSATITVTANAPDVLNGANASCSLREAITNINNAALTYADCANTGAAYGTSDTINIPAGTYTNSLGDISVTNNVTITGAGAGSSIIDGNASSRVFTTSGAGKTISISGVTIQNGRDFNGGGLLNSGATLTITNSAISGNTSTEISGGGGINNSSGSLTINNCVISGNSSTDMGASGGGIINNDIATITNCTISGNSAGNNGGGIFNNGGTITITNSTISGNSVGNTSSGIYNNGTLTITNSTVSGNTNEGIRNAFGTTTLSNTIVADQTAGSDCFISGGTINSNGYNLDSDGTCNLIAGTDIPGSAAANLGALASNGGSTQTMALLTGSAAIDAGDCNGGAVTTDQRGTARPQGSVCDIGAYELAQYQVSVTVSGTGTVADNAGLAGFTIACGATCSDYVLSGDSVTLIATPGAGLVVTWSGACTGNGNCVLSNITADKVVVATFAATPITPTPTPTPTPTTTTTPPNLSGGSVSGSGGNFTVTVTNNGGSVYVYSIGGAGFSIANDNCSGTVVAGHGTCQITVTPSSPITSAVTVTLLLYTNYGSAPVEVRVTLTPATVSTPGTITLLSPSNGATTGSTVTFEWVPAGGGGYQLYICQNADFTACVAITANGSSANRVLFAGAGLIFALGLIAPGGRRRFYVLAFALMMFSSVGLVACGSGGDSSTSANVKYTSTGLAKGAWFWKVTATGFESETRTFTAQ